MEYNSLIGNENNCKGGRQLVWGECEIILDMVKLLTLGRENGIMKAKIADSSL